MENNGISYKELESLLGLHVNTIKKIFDAHKIKIIRHHTSRHECMLFDREESLKLVNELLERRSIRSPELRYHKKHTFIPDDKNKYLNQGEFVSNLGISRYHIIKYTKDLDIQTYRGGNNECYYSKDEIKNKIIPHILNNPNVPSEIKGKLNAKINSLL